MKKFILACFSLVGLLNVNEGYAQSFTIAKDTIRYTVYADASINNTVTNISANDIDSINWKVTAHNLPSSWTTSFNVCDNALCYYSNDILNSDVKTSAKVVSSGSFPIKVGIDLSSVTTYGSYYVTINLEDVATSTDTTMTFIINKFPTGVSSVSRNQDPISLYPNPATDELNVRFDANAGIKNIAVYNLIGKAVTVYKVTGSNSARLNVENIPAGIYFVRLIDTQGRIVATRKFTHQ